MKDRLLQFLFEDSQIAEDLQSVAEDIAALCEEEGDSLKIDKKPLAAALKSLGIGSEGLEMDPRGFSLVFQDSALFHAACSCLRDPENLSKLAEAGWVHSIQGDVAMSNEPAEFRIRFLEIDMVEAGEGDEAESVKEIVKKGREFATEKPEDWDQSSEVPKGDGVGEIPKDQKTESLEPPPVDEGAHKPGCECGFCKNKGSFGKKKKEDEPSEPAMEAQTIVDRLIHNGELESPKSGGHDYSIENHGSIVLIKPLTEAMSEWLRETAPDEAMFHGGALVMEPRYVENFIQVAAENGFHAQLGESNDYHRWHGQGFMVRFADGTYVPKSGLIPITDSGNAYVFRSAMDAHQYAVHATQSGRGGWDKDWKVVPAEPGVFGESNPVGYGKGSPSNPVRGSKVAGNLGTEAPITGIESDRKFTPVKGMVQGSPENSVVSKQIKRKVNEHETCPECGGRVIFWPRNTFAQGAGGVVGFKSGYRCMGCGKQWAIHPRKKGTAAVPPPPPDET